MRGWYDGLLVDSHDTWCGPTDLCAGPDGAIYFSDFYDQRTAHPDPDAHWDMTNGRIYKLQSATAPPSEPIDLARKSSSELVDLLSHTNAWYADRARCLLASRNDRSVLPRLRAMAQSTDHPQQALQGLWALHGIAGLDNSLAMELLLHPEPYMRFWTVRLLGDQRSMTPKLATRLTELVSRESSPVVLAQLAATAKRLPGLQGLPIVQQLLWQQSDENDERIVWLSWWAIEAHALTDTDRLLTLFTRNDAWHNQAARNNGLRLVRHWAAEGTQTGYQASLELLESVPAQYRSGADAKLRLGLAERAVGLQKIGQGSLFTQQAAQRHDRLDSARPYQPLSANNLRHYIEQRWQQQPADLATLELAIEGGIQGAYRALLDAAIPTEGQTSDRLNRVLKLLKYFGRSDTIPIMLNLVIGKQPDPIKVSALDVLARFDSSQVTESLVDFYPHASPILRSRVCQLLLSRPDSALILLALVDQGKIDPKQIPLDQLSRLAVHHDQAIDSLVQKHWGNIGPDTSEEKLATMRRYNNDLRTASGNHFPGKTLFMKHCGICHRLHGEGNQIGPDLTSANRNDRAALLGNIVDPSAVIRREYLAHIVQTETGQVLAGLLAEQDAAHITLLDAKNERIQISRDQIETLEPSDTSLMPERILNSLSPQELRDLFAYLESGPQEQ
ncbi:MAG: c-type cytochrome [Pirellulales bacterium]